MKRILASLLIALGMVGVVVPAPLVLASAKSDIIDSVNSVDPNDGSDVNTAINAAITIFTTIIGIASVIMLLVSAYRYITSGGDGNKVASAKNTAVYALIGIALVVVSQVLVRLVIVKAKQ